MREIMWICVVIIFFSGARAQTTGNNESTSVNSSTSSAGIRVYAERKMTFNLGSEVNLTCSNKTWNETIYLIWKIWVTNKNCKISFSNEGQSEDTCRDGKSLRNTSSAQPYLHIPQFSASDEGLFNCESVYLAGNDNYNIYVAITVPPVTQAWFEHKGNKLVAVCKAEKGNPAANISWSYTGSAPTVQTLNETDNSFTVISRLELPVGMAAENLSCFISHPSMNQEKILKPELKKGQASLQGIERDKTFLWPWILGAVVSLVVLAGVVFLALKKLLMKRQGQQPDSPSKSPKTEDVEEVEPYASYVQRVNSIYNT